MLLKKTKRKKNCKRSSSSLFFVIIRIPNGENYDKIRKADIKPFSFVVKGKEPKKTPYMYIDANVGGGRYFLRMMIYFKNWKNRNS